VISVSDPDPVSRGLPRTLVSEPSRSLGLPVSRLARAAVPVGELTFGCFRRLSNASENGRCEY